MEVNKSFQLSFIEEEIADLLKAGEIKKIENLLFNYFDYLNEWKLHTRILELAERASNQCSFFKCTNFYLALLAFDQQKFEKCQELIKIFVNDHKNSLEQVRNSLGNKRFTNFCKMLTDLNGLGLQENIFFLRKEYIDKTEGPELIEALILSENKTMILTKVKELLDDSTFGTLLTILAAEKSDIKINNWAKRYNANLSILNTFVKDIDFEQDVFLVEKILLSLNLDKTPSPQDEVIKKEESTSDERIKKSDISKVFHSFFFGRKLPSMEVNIFERDWDYQLAHELHLNNEYYLCLVVLEFIKTTKPLGSVDLKMVLHLEQSCSEQLKMPLRVERLKQELLKIN